MKRLALCSLLPLFAACGSSANTLSGSISEQYSLDFDSVAIARTDPFVVVSYVKASGPVAKPAKLAVALTGITVTPKAMIDLAAMVGGATRGTLTRVEATTIEFPIKTGSVVFDEVPDANATITGHFNATLSMPDGRTLNGDFSGPVVLAQ